MTTIRTLLAGLLLALPALTLADPDAAALGDALDNPGRAEADKARDAGRKPAEVISFLGIERGMSVLDVIAAGGYYTEVLSVAVGPTGTVYAQNPAAVLQFRDGANDKALTARLANDRLANVQRWDREFDDLGIEPGSLDAAITALNFHDVYNRDPGAGVGMLRAIHAVLKPGGVLGIIDHAGSPGSDNARLHRIAKADVIEAAGNAGFEVAGDSDLLANPADDHTQGPFTAELRGKTDRLLLKLVKPATARPQPPAGLSID